MNETNILGVLVFLEELLWRKYSMVDPTINYARKRFLNSFVKQESIQDLSNADELASFSSDHDLEDSLLMFW